MQVVVRKPQEASDIEFYNYDLICVSSQSIEPLVDIWTIPLLVLGITLIPNARRSERGGFGKN